MRKYVLSLCLLLITVVAMGQKKSIVNLVHSKSSTGIKLNGKDLVKVYQGTFKQDYSTLTSDSAYFYPQDNAFDAFGHVIINQGDTLNIYSDKLNYNGNTKIAILTDNVRMVDKDATLTTNHLTYNTATRIGIYTDGGKLVNKDNTLLSKNGYYFAFTRDSYFRYDVSLTTPDALIKTDTMRYNTGSKIAYFYGPTNIYSTKGEKDRDTLYTENGNYNTGTEQAAFGKNNLYHSGTKSLKGDSLYYDKIKGYGRAVKHVTFTDNEQKTTIKGQLGTYFKSEEKTIVTEDPYIIIVTEQKDTTKTNSVAKVAPVIKKPADEKKPTDVKVKNNMNMADLIKNSIPKNTIPAKIDTVAITQILLNNIPKDSLTKAKAAISKMAANPATRARADSLARTLSSNPNISKAKADSLIRGLTIDPKNGSIKSASTKKGNSKIKTTGNPVEKGSTPARLTAPKDTSKLKRDSIYMSGDTIETQILTYKNLKIYQEQQRLAHMRDTSSKAKKVKNEKESKFLTGYRAGVASDTAYRHRDFFGKPKPIPKKVPKPLSKKQLAADSVRKKVAADSLAIAKKLEPSDTARIRILIVHHHAKLFKSDMQAKADSMFYSYSDSTIRCFVNPMMWSEGSQLSGDTIYLQIKHKKMDNMTMFPNSFIANIEKGDSVHFNQIAGKKMRGFFKDDKLSRMYVDGNAESIYFSRDSVKHIVDGMERSLSSRISAKFKNNEVTDMGFYTKPEHKYGPLEKFKEDERILKGFIWKPKDRPFSKESIIPSYYNKKKPEKAAADKSKPGKPGLKKLPDGKTVKDTSANKTPLPGLKTGKDSTATSPLKPPGLKKDSTLNNTPTKLPAVKKDSTLKATPVKTPAVKAAKDSVTSKPPGGQ